MTLQDITLAHYQQNDLQVVKRFQLLEMDNKFVKTPYDNIVAALEDYHRYPIMVWRNNECVAFFTLHIENGVAPFSDNTKAIFLDHSV